MDPIEVFCSAASRGADEAQFGTAAAGVDAWFALEYDGEWASNAWEAASVPAGVRAHVDAWVAATAGARVQLIRQPTRRGSDDVVLLLANTRQDRPTLAEYRLPTIDALAQIDLRAAIAELRAGRLPPGAAAPAQPVVLVCTNGKRDRCCAKWGTPAYEALATDERVQTWQTTHLGGHRFAATMVWLPAGICHGRVAPADLEDLVTDVTTGQIGPLALLRGRTSLAEAGQAAEYLCRQEQGLFGLDDVVIERVKQEGDTWIVAGQVLGEPVRFAVRSTLVGTSAPPSCGKDPAPVRRWELV